MYMSKIAYELDKQDRDKEEARERQERDQEAFHTIRGDEYRPSWFYNDYPFSYRG